MLKILTAALLSVIMCSASHSASALTTAEFMQACEAVDLSCSEHPLLHAYIGGGLDLLATLDEETAYMETLYCGDPKEVFDVPAIIRYMEDKQDEYADRNAMLLLVRYFEERGGCDER